MTFFVKNHYDELIKRFDYFLYHETEFNRIKHMTPNNNIEKAYRTFCLLNMTISASGSVYRFCSISNEAKTVNNKIQLLSYIHERIKNVQFVNRDFRNLLKQANDDCMIYADPPYYGLSYYKYNFTEQDHIDLANILNSLNCSTIVSYVYFDGIEQLYPKDKWNYIEVEHVKHSNALKKVKDKYKELLLINYDSTLFG